MPVAARNHPRPTAPTPRRSSAIAGKQRDRATEQHREEVERDRAEQDRLAAHEAQTLDGLVQARSLLRRFVPRFDGCAAYGAADSRTVTNPMVTAETVTSTAAAANGTQGSTT